MSDRDEPTSSRWRGKRSADAWSEEHDEFDILADSFAEFDAALSTARPDWVDGPPSANPLQPLDPPSWLRLPSTPVEPAPAPVVEPLVGFERAAEFETEAGYEPVPEAVRPPADDLLPDDLVLPGWLDEDGELPGHPGPRPVANEDQEAVVASVAPELIDDTAVLEPWPPAESRDRSDWATAPALSDEAAAATATPPAPSDVDRFDLPDGVAPRPSGDAALLDDASLPRDPAALPPAAPIRVVPLSEDEVVAPVIAERPTTPVAGVPLVVIPPSHTSAPPPVVPDPPDPPPAAVVPDPPGPPPAVVVPDPPDLPSPLPTQDNAVPFPPQPPAHSPEAEKPEVAKPIDAFDRPLARKPPEGRDGSLVPQRPSQAIIPFDASSAAPSPGTVPLIPDLAAGRSAPTLQQPPLPPLVPTPAGWVPQPEATFQHEDVVAALANVPPARFSRFLTWLVPFLLVGLGISAYVLAQQGAAEFLDSTGGRLQASVADPGAPGYVALVDPTPSMLMLWVDGFGHLSGVSILSAAADDEGGSVLVMPPFTRFRPGDDTLYMAYENDGVDGVESAVSRHLRIAFGETELIDGDRWEQLLEPVEPLPIVVTDPLITRNEAGGVGVRFPAGTSSIAAEDMVDFLGWRNPDEVQLNQQFRHGQFWDSWVGAIFDQGVDAVPGESESGVGRFVRALANGEARIQLLPFTEERADSVSPSTEQSDAAVPAEAIVVIPDGDALSETIVEMIPFPVAPVSSPRPRVRLLDGADNPRAVLEAAERLVGAGAQIALLGNADTFEIDLSRVVYHGAEAEADAQSYADVLGASGVEGDSGASLGVSEIEAQEVAAEGADQRTIDVTIVVGADIVSGLTE